jgi:hypothetical protein
MTDHDDRAKAPDATSRLHRSPAQHREAERMRASDAIDATFPAPASASPDELVQMAIHALGFDAGSLAAALGIARSEGETLVRAPGTLTRRHRALLAQYLEMQGASRNAARNAAIAAKLRESIAQGDRAAEAGRSSGNPPR